MRKALQKFGAAGLSFLLLFSTLTLHLKMHFCGDHLVDIALGNKAATCAMEPLQKELSGTCFMSAMNCCSDLDLYLRGQEDFQNGILTAAPIPVYTIILSAPTLQGCMLFRAAPERKLGFNAHSPPPLIQKTHIIYGVFII